MFRMIDPLQSYHSRAIERLLVALRVRPESSSRITDLSEHKSDRRKAEKRDCVAC